MQHIAKVGFELEGGWNGTRRVSPFPDLTLITDGSINGQQLVDAPIHAVHVGEAVSAPIEVEAVDPEGQLLWEKWLLEHWPNAAAPNRTNSTCGFHIHISLKSHKDYYLLSSKIYLLDLQKAMQSLGKRLIGEWDASAEAERFWLRVSGKNAFCGMFFDPAKQMKVKKDGGIHKVRYGWLNFSWAAHGTMEFRALPLFFEPTLGVRFAREFFFFTNAWLEEMGEREVVKEVQF